MSASPKNGKNTVVITVDNITGFDSTAPADSQTLTITVGGKTTTCTVTINAAPVAVIDIEAIRSNGSCKRRGSGNSHNGNGHIGPSNRGGGGFGWYSLDINAA